MEYIKSPLNYIGGKYKLLPQILPLFPQKINKFIDLFGGGANVSVNVKALNIIYNELQPQTVDLLENLSKLNTEESYQKIIDNINKYNLSKKNEEGYKQLRKDYNNGNKSWDMFYTLICYSFNNQIRFNSKGEFNLPFGKNRSSFNPALQEKFINFVNTLHDKNIVFTNRSFQELKIDKLSSNDFVYCDPPYLITCASYNEKNGWNETLEKELLKLLDRLNNEDIKFALSNVLEDSGKSNDVLKDWAKKYKINKLENTYKNCNYQKKDKSENSTIEVLITNY